MMGLVRVQFKGARLVGGACVRAQLPAQPVVLPSPCVGCV